MYLNKTKTWLLAGFSSLCMLYACTDDDYATGLEIHPKNELINVGHDSSQNIMVYTYENENELDVSSTVTRYMLGYCKDPILGEFTNDIAFHIKNEVPTTNFLNDTLVATEEDEIFIDSLVLIIECVESDGYIDNNQSFSILEMEHDKELIDINDMEYVYEENPFNYFKSTPILSSYEFKPLRSWSDTNVTKNKFLRVHIDNQEFINRLVTDEVFSYDIDSVWFRDSIQIINNDTLKVLDTVKITCVSNYNNDSLFQANVLNGFMLKSITSNSQSISSINFGSENSTRLELYYRREWLDTTTNPNSYVMDTLVHSYNISDQNKANFNYKKWSDHFTANSMYTNIFEDNVETDTIVAIKNNNGSSVKVLIDNIGDWSDSTNIVINKASVFLELNEWNYLDSTLNTEFGLLPSLLPYTGGQKEESFVALQGHIDANRNIVPIPPRYTPLGFGYEILVTQEVQDLFRARSWDEPIILSLYSASNLATPKRVVLNSSTNSKPTKFIITYSKY